MADFELTLGQKTVLGEVISTILKPVNLNDTSRFHTMHGPAGSGKTTVLQKIISQIPAYKTIGFCSPTHKSVKVIRRMAREAGISHRVDIRTIHSALGLVMKPVRGDEVLVKEPFAEERIYDVLIIDEAGMLNDELIMYILESQSSKVIFVGDMCQIGPIQSNLPEEDGYTPTSTDDVSKVFTEVEMMSALTEVVRQAEGSPIIQLATEFRLAQDDIYADLPRIVTNTTPDGNGIITMPNGNWVDSAVARFQSDQFKEDPDHCRIVCYTNAMVDFCNDLVRKRLFGADVPEWLEDEILVAQEMGSTWNNADELRIVSIDDHFDQQYEVPCWRMQLESVEDHKLHNALVVKGDYIEDFKFRLNAIAERANTDKNMSGMHWKEFWGMRKKFNTFKNVYAGTAHKSQGSTFDYTYVFTPDFYKFGATMTIKRLLYTAITRSRYTTYFAMNTGAQ
ncbi:P-loop containing nucleoside triphosphate hydrolase [Vibrio phage 3.058.O._10N.286.46.B8]|nr:P-loop containing nucleoside triphosphate hydrolase [Vibrio phage 2.058.O._10N.286.46.B8]AUS03163.1 P-loop containing nucleoside triphosphate hydrolase [Vibrio phage 3.058.O._10N.286.46.B8]